MFYIVLFALLLRLIVCFELSRVNGGANNVFMPSPSTDLATYMTLAKEVADGKFTGEFYYQPFYYAVFLPALYLVSNGSVWLVMIVQSMLGAATVWLAGLIAREIFGGKAAMVAAALLAAFAAPLLLYTPYHQNETLQTFNLALILYLALVAMRKCDWRWWAAAGFWTGIAILTRGNAWFFVPGLAAAILASGLKKGRSGKYILAVLAVTATLTLAVQLPFAWRNSTISGVWRGPSTAADAVLALGNTREAPAGGRDPGLPAGPMEYPESWHKLMDSKTPAISYALDWLKTEPLSFFELQFRKLLLFWDYREIPNNVSMAGDGVKSFVIRVLNPCSSGVIITLGLAGLLFHFSRIIRRRDFALALLDYFIVAYWLAAAAFYILGRFRAPVLPLLAVSGGGFIASFWEIRHQMNRQLAMRFAAAALIGAFVSLFGYEFYRNNLERTVMRIVRPEGTRDWGVTFDHGPMTFGGWEIISPGPGDRVVKHLAGTQGHGRLAITFLIEQPCKSTIMLNGKSHVLIFSEPGLQQREFETNINMGIAVIEVIDPGKMNFIADYQRDYNRSEFNGATIPAEWVMRFR